MIDRAAQAFTFQIFCRSGVLVRGASADFLLCVHRAKSAKTSAAATFPHSTLRAQILSPKGERVSSSDLKSALSALSDAGVLALLRKRNPASFPQFSAGRGAVAFSQAGVVAPPDSLTGGNRPDLNLASSGV